MRKIFFISSFLTLFSFSTFAQFEKANVVKFNFSSLAILDYQFQYERGFNDRISVNFGLPISALSYSSTVGGSAGEASIFGIGAIPELRFHPGDKPAPKGFYVGPYGVYRNYTLKMSATDLNGNSGEGKTNFSLAGGGLLLGHQWLIADVFSIDWNFGLGYYNIGVNEITVEYTDGTIETTDDLGVLGKISGVLPKMGFTLGMAF